MEIAGAYAVFANSGVARGAERDRGRHDRRRHGARPQGRASGAGAAGRRRLPVNSILKGAVEPRHRRRARARAGLTGVLAGKTGTTNDGRDAWFVGFSPRFLAAVWVGYDDNRGLNLSGTQAAVPIFADFSRVGAGAVLRGGLSRCPPTS